MARESSQAPPLNNYDELNVEDVENKVRGLSKEEIRGLLDYEKRHKNRKTLVEPLSRKV
jgi:hypothetical protein